MPRDKRETIAGIEPVLAGCPTCLDFIKANKDGEDDYSLSQMARKMANAGKSFWGWDWWVLTQSFDLVAKGFDKIVPSARDLVRVGHAKRATAVSLSDKYLDFSADSGDATKKSAFTTDAAALTINTNDPVELYVLYGYKKLGAFINTSPFDRDISKSHGPFGLFLNGHFRIGDTHRGRQFLETFKHIYDLHEVDIVVDDLPDRNL